MGTADNKNGLTPDQAAAHEFLSELRTRISTQPLPYQYGVEARALESLWEVFGYAREAMKNNPGCALFAFNVTKMLNVDLRPVTAKWHRAYLEGRLSSRDGADEFRADLAAVQVILRNFARTLNEMAYGSPAIDELTPPAVTDAEIERLFANLPFGISEGQAIPKAVVDDINSSERAAVAVRRHVDVNSFDAKNAVGLGLSGGGIRSATFCLGVVQVLAERDLLKDIDFLSTVSGGGYVGSFLTMRLGHGELSADVAAPHGPDPIAVRYLRQHAKYLAANDLKERWSMVTASLAGLLLNWTAPLFLIALAALISVGITRCFSPLPWMTILGISSVITFAALLFYGFLIRYARKDTGGITLGIMAAITLSLAFIWVLTKIYNDWLPEHFGFGWKLSGLIAVVIPAIPTILRFVPILKKPSVQTIALKVALAVAGLIIPLGAIALLFLFFAIGTQCTDSTSACWPLPQNTNGYLLLTVVTILLGFVATFLLNVNVTGPHRLYRDMLARTFVQTRDDDPRPIPLTAINPQNSAPYHLINTAVNLPSSTNIALRERKSDFFLFSKYWSGSPSTGYFKTERWEANRSPVDLATVMAISGAAASSHMGLASFPTLAALLTFLNVRLGFWILRPDRRPWSHNPGFLCLMREMTGFAMSEKCNWLNLSDGGHIENMGVYELLRRRCKFIISIDGEADPKSTFQGHLTLVRHAQIDFGIRIEPNLESLRPDLKSKFSQSHAMLSRIFYPATADMPAGYGLILYLKLSVTGNELEMIKRYRILHPEFPHQSTLNQFFDEEQFEAYRQLGVHVAEGMFSRVLLNGQNPANVGQWFKLLAQNLIEPGGTN